MNIKIEVRSRIYRRAVSGRKLESELHEALSSFSLSGEPPFECVASKLFPAFPDIRLSESRNLTLLTLKQAHVQHGKNKTKEWKEKLKQQLRLNLINHVIRCKIFNVAKIIINIFLKV